MGRTFQLHGPFDGIFAFSQGAALASLMCLMKERAQLAPAIDFKFAIMVASFKSLSTKHQKWYGEDAKKVTMPTLHVFGSTDNVIKKHLSEDLLSLFENASKMVHPGGHYVPAKAQQRTGYFSFLRKASLLRDPEPEIETETPAGDNAAAVPDSPAEESDKAPAGDSAKQPKTEDKKEVPVVTDENQNKPAAVVDQPDAPQPLNA